MKVVFVGGEFRNKGCEAMIMSTSATLKKLMPSTNFTVISRHREDTKKDWGDQIKVVWDNARNVKLRIFLILAAFLHRAIPSKNFRYLLTRNNPILKQFVDADVVIDISGFALTDDIGLKRILIFCSGIFLSKLLGTPFVVYPQAMGPFNSPWSRMVIKLFLPMADLVMVRGNQTKKSLEEIGIDTSKMHLCADSAFLFKAALPDRATEILESYGMVKKKLVGVVPSVRIYDRSDRIGTAKKYVILLANMIDFIVNEFDVQVVLMPFEFMSNEHDDRLLVNEVFKNVKRKKSVLALNKEYRAAELKAIIGQCEFLLASRFHSIVLSLSLSVPVVAIGWSNKYVELMGHFGLEEYALDYNHVSSGLIENKMKRIWLNKEEVVKKLKIERKNIEISARKAAELVRGILSSSKINN